MTYDGKPMPNGCPLDPANMRRLIRFAAEVTTVQLHSKSSTFMARIEGHAVPPERFIPMSLQEYEDLIEWIESVSPIGGGNGEIR